MHPAAPLMQHPVFTRRTALQAGSVGLLGLGMNHVAALRALAADNGITPAGARAKTCIYIFLSGGLSQHDSFDLKPDAPDTIRGEFKPIATRTPGIQICEHLPLLAQRSHQWSLVRSLTHPTNDHSAGHLFMLTGRSQLPPGFNGNMPKPTDWPSHRRRRRRCHAAAQQPAAGRRPAGKSGPQHRPRHSRPVRRADGPCNAIRGSSSFRLRAGCLRGVSGVRVRPSDAGRHAAAQGFRGAQPVAAGGRQHDRFGDRLDLLRLIDRQRRDLDAGPPASARPLAQSAVSLLTDPRNARAFDLDARRPAHPGPLRQQRFRLVAADGPAAGRGRRQPGAGQPRQQRNLGHARHHLPAPEGQTLAADGSRSSRPCSTTWTTAVCWTTR